MGLGVGGTGPFVYTFHYGISFLWFSQIFPFFLLFFCFPLYFFLYLVCMCVHTSTSVFMWYSEDNVQDVVLSYPVGPRIEHKLYVLMASPFTHQANLTVLVLIFLKDLFIYYVYIVQPPHMPAGQKRAPNLITDGCESPCGYGNQNQDLWKSSQCS